MIGFIVDNLHVWTEDREVIRAIWSRLGSEYKRGRKHRTLRRKLYCQALKRHHANQQLCRDFRL